MRYVLCTGAYYMSRISTVMMRGVNYGGLKGPPYIISTTRFHTDGPVTHLYEIATITISGGGLTHSSVWHGAVATSYERLRLIILSLGHNNCYCLIRRLTNSSQWHKGCWYPVRTTYCLIRMPSRLSLFHTEDLQYLLNRMIYGLLVFHTDDLLTHPYAISILL